MIDLDPRYYGSIAGLESRFPEGAPSLARCERLTIRGDHRFGADVVVEGRVELVNEGAVPVVIETGRRLSGR